MYNTNEWRIDFENDTSNCKRVSNLKSKLKLKRGSALHVLHVSEFKSGLLGYRHTQLRIRDVANLTNKRVQSTSYLCKICMSGGKYVPVGEA